MNKQTLETRRGALMISNIAWDFIWQRHQTIASLFARDFDVTFCEIPGVRRVGLRDLPRMWRRLKRIWSQAPLPAGTEVRVLRPFVLPSTNALFCAVNERLVDRFVRRTPVLATGVDIVWTYSAARPAMRLVQRVPHRVLAYDCTDNFAAVHGVPRDYLLNESQLLAKTNITFVPGSGLAKRHRARTRRIEVLPHGALIERFRIERRPREPGSGVSLVYYGHIHHQHLDCELIAQVARLRPAWQMVLVGPVVTPYPFPRNVLLVGQQPHEHLREFLSAADAILLPYAINDYTRAVFPAKTYECLATGLPIVATPLPELRAGVPDLIRFASGPGPVIAEIEKALRDDTPHLAAARIAAAEQNSWDARYARIRAILDELAPTRMA